MTKEAANITPEQARKHYETYMKHAKDQFIENVLKGLDQAKQKIPWIYRTHGGGDRSDYGNLYSGIDQVKNKIQGLKGQNVDLNEAYKLSGAYMSALPQSVSGLFGGNFQIISDILPTAIDSSVNRSLDQAAMFGQIARQTPATPAAGKGAPASGLDQLANKLHKEWGHVFKRRGPEGYKRFLKWRMDNFNMSPEEAYDDLNRLWSRRYGRKGRGRGRGTPGAAAPGKQPPAPPSPPGAPEPEAKEKKPGEEATPALSNKEKEEQWLKQRMLEEGATLTPRQINSIKKDVFKDKTGVGLRQLPKGWQDSIEQFLNAEIRDITNRYEDRAIKSIKRDQSPTMLASDNMRRELGYKLRRVGLGKGGMKDVERFVNNWNKYRTEYGSYEGIQQPKWRVTNPYGEHPEAPGAAVPRGTPGYARPELGKEYYQRGR